MATSLAFFAIGGVMALLMRAELARPGMQFLTPEQYNQLFTMHGTIMLLFFATPIVFAFANLVLPLQIGSPDVAFPRLNAFSYWLYLFGALMAMSGLPHPGRRRRRRLDALRAAEQRAQLARAGHRPVDHRPGHRRPGHDPRRRQHGDHRDHAARARHDDVPDADLHLEHPGDEPADPARVPDPHRGAAGAVGRPAHARAGLRPGQRRRDPVAAPVLVLRPSRGLHHRVAVLRHRHRSHPGVQPQAAVRLQGHGARDAVHRGAVADGVGAPHVHHRRGAAAVLLA